jgi:hypothetical protein
MVYVGRAKGPRTLARPSSFVPPSVSGVCPPPPAILLSLATFVVLVNLIISTIEGGRGGVRSSTVAPASSNDDYRYARDQSYGYFDDVPTRAWDIHREIYRSVDNHRHSDRPLLFSDHDPLVPNDPGYGSPRAWWGNNYEPNFGGCQFERRIGGNGDGPKWVRVDSLPPSPCGNIYTSVYYPLPSSFFSPHILYIYARCPIDEIRIFYSFPLTNEPPPPSFPSPRLCLVIPLSRCPFSYRPPTALFLHDM